MGLFRQLTDCSLISMKISLIDFIDQYEVDALIQIIEEKTVEAANAAIPMKKVNN